VFYHPTRERSQCATISSASPQVPQFTWARFAHPFQLLIRFARHPAIGSFASSYLACFANQLALAHSRSLGQHPCWPALTASAFASGEDKTTALTSRPVSTQAFEPPLITGRSHPQKKQGRAKGTSPLPHARPTLYHKRGASKLCPK